MLSPRESTYKRQCNELAEFFDAKLLLEREEILATHSAEDAKLLLKSPRDRAREILEQRPSHVTEVLKKKAFYSDILLRKPAPAYQHTVTLQAATPNPHDPRLQGKPHWACAGLKKL